MKKEKYITPDVEAVAIDEADVITTSPETDELIGVNGGMLDPSDPLYDLF